ncbi:amino acid ABC transporter permease [Vagococcus elongatus]|uniref:ABC transporter permease n=1 Tax=Vagococcus elongatus TaxID=180344 RepID=A0A430ARR2_9ENTE|nr:amino acid ABC transporter permease [Vagococcus elongatus]RSU10745.1 ABC transporter permease [Vagococcus elongatus]
MDIVIRRLPNLLNGSLLTLEYSLFSLVLGLLLGVFIALMRDSNYRLLSGISWFYIWVFRGTPLMVQLFIIYFGLSQFNIIMTPFVAGILGMTLNNGSYIAEIVRSGIHGVDEGEREAARALGMRYWTEMRRIVAPQAAKQCMLPMVNQFISTIKNSSILSVITVAELTREGQVIANSSFNYFPVYITVAALYLIMTSLCMVLSNWLQRRLG